MGACPEQLGFVKWSILELCFPPTHQRPSEWQELSLRRSKQIKQPHLSLLRSRKPPQLHVCRKALGGQKGRSVTPQLGSNVTLPLGLAPGIPLSKKMCTHMRRALRQVRCGKGARGNTDLEGLPYVRGLKHLWLRTPALLPGCVSVLL